MCQKYLLVHSLLLKVATFNQRAIRVYENAGFHPVCVFMHTTNGGEYECLEMTMPCDSQPTCSSPSSTSVKSGQDQRNIFLIFLFACSYLVVHPVGKEWPMNSAPRGTHPLLATFPMTAGESRTMHEPEAPMSLGLQHLGLTNPDGIVISCLSPQFLTGVIGM
jgi:hypothetical protein